MNNKKSAGLIGVDLISIKPMDFEFIPPPGMTGGHTFWSTITVLPTDKRLKILKVKEWLSAKNMNIEIVEFTTRSIIDYRYSKVAIDNRFYGTIKITEDGI